MKRTRVFPTRWMAALAVAVIAASLGAATADDLRALIPADAQIITVAPAADQLHEGVNAFLGATGLPIPQVPVNAGLAMWLEVPVGEPAVAGIALDGPTVGLFRAGQWAWVQLVTLRDAEAFATAMSAIAAEEREHAGTRYWVTSNAPQMDPLPVSGCAAIVGDIAVIAGANEADLLAALEPHDPPALAAAIDLSQPGTLTAVVDVAGLIETHRTQIDGALAMLEGMGAMLDQQQGMAGPMSPSKMLGMYAEMAQRLLEVGAQTDHLAVTVTPSADALRIDDTIRFRAGSDILTRLSRHIESDLTLAHRLPPNAVFEFVSTFDAERDAALMADFATLWFDAMDDTPEGDATVARLTQAYTDLYGDIGDEIAFALYPSPGGGFIPASVMIMRAPDPATSLTAMVEMMDDPDVMAMMTGAFGVSPETIQYEEMSTEEIAGHTVRHLRLSGMGNVMTQMMGTTPNAPPGIMDMMSGLDALDYWFVATDDTLVITTEPQPTLLAHVLGEAGVGLQPPAIAAPITDGADAVFHLSLHNALAWFSGMAGMMEENAPPMLAAIEQALVNEQGIWASAAMLNDGLTISLVVPTTDVAAIARAAMSAPRPGMAPSPGISQGGPRHAQSDMRSMATAIEAYRIDWNVYPPAAPRDDLEGRSGFANGALTTPIAYLRAMPSAPISYATLDASDPLHELLGDWALISPGPDGDWDIDLESQSALEVRGAIWNADLGGDGDHLRGQRLPSR